MIDIVKEDLEKISENNEKEYHNTYQDEMASVYDTFYNSIDGWYESQEDIVRENGKGNILELACGSGILLSRLEDWDGELTGLDYSSHMVEIARERVSDNISVKEGDFNEMTYRNEFDTVVMLGNPINHYKISELSNLFSGISDALTEDGVLIYDLIPHDVWSQGESINISVKELDTFEIIRSAFSIKEGTTKEDNYKNRVYFAYMVKNKESGFENTISIDEELFSHPIESHREILSENGLRVKDEFPNNKLEERSKYIIIGEKL